MPLFNTTLFNAALFGGPVGLPGFAPRQVGKGLLYPALRKAGVTLGPQRTPSPAQFQDSIDELNRLVGTLNCDRLFIYSIARAEYPLTGGQTAYTIGEPADPFAQVDFLAQRPQLIESANILSGGTAVTRLAIATDPEWSKICCGQGNGMGAALYNDRAFPVSTLYLSGPPAGDTLELFTWMQVPYFLTLTDEVLLPMQYEDALVLNLAIRLVTHFPLNPTQPRIVDPALYQQAREALMHLRSINAPQPIAVIPWAFASDYNVYTDGFTGGGGASPVQAPSAPTAPGGSAGTALSYAGVVERDGAMHGPAGWTIAHPSTGVYTITHNLNLNPIAYSVVATFARGTLDPIDPGKASGIVVHVRNQQPNFFTVVMGEGKDLTSFIDAGFNFTLS